MEGPLFEPTDARPSGRRNQTPNSERSNRAVEAFWESGLATARLNSEAWGGMEQAYRSTRSVCCKKAWVRKVEVHRQDGQVYMRRTDGGKAQ